MAINVWPHMAQTTQGAVYHSTQIKVRGGDRTDQQVGEWRKFTRNIKISDFQ